MMKLTWYRAGGCNFMQSSPPHEIETIAADFWKGLYQPARLFRLILEIWRDVGEMQIHRVNKRISTALRLETRWNDVVQTSCLSKPLHFFGRGDLSWQQYARGIGCNVLWRIETATADRKKSFTWVSHPFGFAYRPKVFRRPIYCEQRSRFERVGTFRRSDHM